MLTRVLDTIPVIDALILSSPLYFGLVTGMKRCSLERFLFTHLASTNPPLSLFPRKIPTACIDTMNISEPQTNEFYRGHIDTHEAVLPMMFGHAESFFSNETLQFEEYNRMDSSFFDPEVRKERHRAVFPEDCRGAHELGSQLAGKEVLKEKS